MRNTKKVISILLTLLMVVGMMSTFAFAADYTGNSSDNATITIDNASKGQKYALYKIFDAKTGANGSITYTLMKGKTELPDLKVNKGGTEVSAFTIEKGTITSNYNDNFGSTLSDSDKKILKGYGKLIKEVQATSNEVIFAGLEFGYYLVETDNGTVISVNSTTPNAVIKDKNTNTPVIPGDGGKFKTIVDGNSVVTTKPVHYGENVTYKITFQAENYVNGKLVEEYYVTDTTSPAGLLANVEITEVMVGETNITADLKGNANKLTYDTNGKLTIPWAENGVSKYNNKSIVKITYTGEITDKQAIAGEGSYNTATLSHKDANGITTDIEDQKVITKSYAAAIKKVNNKGEALTGVEFTLPFDVVKITDGVYRRAISKDTEKTKVVTDKDGMIVINGLDTSSFEITETKAPDGYTLPVDKFTITPKEVGTTVTTTTFKVYMKDGEIVSRETEGATETEIAKADIAATPLVVVNEQGTALPSTGGIGTTIFYLIGAILVIGAGVVFVTRRRMHSDK